MTTPADYRTELQLLLDACNTYADPAPGRWGKLEAAIARAESALAKPYADPEEERRLGYLQALLDIGKAELATSPNTANALCFQVYHEQDEDGISAEEYSVRFSLLVQRLRGEKQLKEMSKEAPHVSASPETIKQARALLDPAPATEEVDGICTGCDTPRYEAIAAVAKGGIACCPDCSTLTSADRNAIREAVAQRPATEGATDEELLSTYRNACQEYWDSPNEKETVLPVMVLRGLRAVLARFAHPAPVPVGERLPGVGDCCPHPRRGIRQWCWGLEKARTSYGLECVWRLMEPEDIPVHATHWLPHWALPLPGDQPLSPGPQDPPR